MAGVGETIWQVEKDPYCRAVLAKHWPNATRYNDVCTVGAHNLASVDVICGGFPCQDISYAGKGAGLEGERSGLWYEFARIVGEMGPRYVVVENVAALLTRGLDAVLGTLADLGYDAEWSGVQACDVGAPHRRDRIFIIAYADVQPKPAMQLTRGTQRHRAPASPWTVDALDAALRRHSLRESNVADADCWEHEVERVTARVGRVLELAAEGVPTPRAHSTPPVLCRVDDGIPDLLDRLRSLGNAVVPQVAEVVGRRLLEIDAALGMEAA